MLKGAIEGACLNFFDHAVTGNDVAEDDVLPVQPVRLGRGNEELAAVGPRPGVGHAEYPGSGVGQLKVLVCELGPVDGPAAGTVVVGEVSSLD